MIVTFKFSYRKGISWRVTGAPFDAVLSLCSDSSLLSFIKSFQPSNPPACDQTIAYSIMYSDGFMSRHSASQGCPRLTKALPPRFKGRPQTQRFTQSSSPPSAPAAFKKINDISNREQQGQKKLPSFEELVKDLKLPEHGNISISRTFENSAFQMHRQMLTNYTTNSNEVDRGTFVQTGSEHSPQQTNITSSPTEFSQSEILTGDEGIEMSKSLVSHVQSLLKEETHLCVSLRFLDSIRRIPSR